MCVIILAEEENQRPSDNMLEKAWDANDDGFGVAWREPSADGNGMDVLWKKGIMDKGEAIELCNSVPMPFVAHFRKSSPMFQVRPSLTHPFEVSERANWALSGRGKNSVLFHNGTWADWHKVALDVAARSGVGIPVGPFSDTRGIAWLTAVMGDGFMNFIPDQRGVLFGPDGLELFSGPGWVKYTDPATGFIFWCSNNKPWPATFQPQQGQQGKGTNRASMCHAARCIRYDIDADGYCPMHPGGSLMSGTFGKPATGGTVANPTIPFSREDIKLDSGGNPVAKLPFRPITQGPIISMAQADALAKRGLFTKGLAKEVRDCYSQMGTGKLKKQQRAIAALRLATQLLTWCETGKAHSLQQT